MPTATPFKAIGKGNGFPYCPTGYIDFFGQPNYPSRVNVSNYSKWTTLGGYNSNSLNAVTESQINLSRQRAMQLYWNLYQVNCSLSSIDTLYPYNESITNIFTNTQPKNRVCSFSNFTKKSQSQLCVVGVNVAPLWLFNGSVTNWNNFIGFSVGNDFLLFINSYSIGYSGASEVELLCASNSGTLTNISGYPFVCKANGDDTDENNLTAESDDSGTLPDGTPYTRTSSVSISSLSFYTY